VTAAKPRPRHRRHIVKRLSHAQAMLTAGAVATLIIWVYAAWVQGQWPPAPTAEAGGALSIIMVTIFVWLFTSEDIVDATQTDVTVTGDHSVITTATGSGGVQQPAAGDGPDSER
jgi:hypothetical protein